MEMTEIDNDEVGQAIALGDRNEKREQEKKPANDPGPPMGKTGS